MRKNRIVVYLLVGIILWGMMQLHVGAIAVPPYIGVPDVKLEVSRLDSSGKLIYCGIDFAVFEDPDRDGIFTVKPGKVKRILSTSTTFEIGLGDAREYRKGILHKLAMRTLYVAAGTDQHDIIITDWHNGKEGWVEIPDSLFQPSYFAPTDSPYILHTAKWEENRTLYNQSKLHNGLENQSRSQGTFWSGERFLVEVETTDIVPELAVKIKDTKYSSELSLQETTTKGGIYTGAIWSPEMVNKWGNYLPKNLIFELQVIDEGEIVESIETTVTVDNQEPYYRVKRKY